MVLDSSQLVPTFSSSAKAEWKSLKKLWDCIHQQSQVAFPQKVVSKFYQFYSILFAGLEQKCIFWFVTTCFQHLGGQVRFTIGAHEDEMSKDFFWLQAKCHSITKLVFQICGNFLPKSQQNLWISQVTGTSEKKIKQELESESKQRLTLERLEH